MRIALVGLGKMGRAIETVAGERGHEVTARVELGGPALAEVVEAARPDVAFEFTQPSAARENVTALLRLRVPVVCGTTGWAPKDLEPLTTETGTPLLAAANFSIGVAVLRRIVCEAAAALRAFPEFEPGLVERHHSAKVDAPSGTANVLADIIARASGRESVPVVSLRQGGQPGEHSIIFEGAAESLVITHQARSRDIFATGAVRAAEWLVQARPAGLLDFEMFLERSGSWNRV
ncbi:MAG: dihydrodipicolinate reductase [Phycisphaerae bacterium]|nr:dihydrodipicolinate reductase [Phycisphaerae bacterium]